MFLTVLQCSVYVYELYSEADVRALSYDDCCRMEKYGIFWNPEIACASTLCPSKSLKTKPTPVDSFNQWRPSLINNSGRKAAQESMTTGMIQRPCRPGFQLWHGIHGRINNPRAVTDIKKIGALSLAVGMVGAQSRNGLTLLLFYIPPSRTLRTIRLHTNEFSY